MLWTRLVQDFLAIKRWFCTLGTCVCIYIYVIYYILYLYDIYYNTVMIIINGTGNQGTQIGRIKESVNCMRISSSRFSFWNILCLHFSHNHCTPGHAARTAEINECNQVFTDVFSLAIANGYNFSIFTPPKEHLYRNSLWWVAQAFCDTHIYASTWCVQKEKASDIEIYSVNYWTWVNEIGKQKSYFARRVKRCWAPGVVLCIQAVIQSKFRFIFISYIIYMNEYTCSKVTIISVCQALLV